MKEIEKLTFAAFIGFLIGMSCFTWLNDRCGNFGIDQLIKRGVVEYNKTTGDLQYTEQFNKD